MNCISSFFTSYILNLIYYLDAKDCEIVTFASPSAVRTWSSRCGNSFVAVTIGPTSAKAASSFKQVISPNGSKGIEAWAELIIKVVNEYDSGVC